MEKKWKELPKVHVVVHHYKFYFESTGKTLKETNGEFTETCHSTLRKSEECHGQKVVRKIGTPIHQYQSLKSPEVSRDLFFGVSPFCSFKTVDLIFFF